MRRLGWAFVIGWLLGRAVGLAETRAELRRTQEIYRAKSSYVTVPTDARSPKEAPYWDRWSF